MALTVNRYNEPVMNAVNFIAGETANKKRQERQSALNMQQDKAYLAENAKWNAIANRGQWNRDDIVNTQLWDREDQRNRLNVLGNLMGETSLPQDQRVAYNEELNKGLGIETEPVAESFMPFTPLVDKYWPDLKGSEKKFRPEHIEMINKRAESLESAALAQQQADTQDDYYKDRGRASRAAAGDTWVQVEDELLPYTGGKRSVTDQTYRAALDEFNKDRSTKQKQQLVEMDKQIADIDYETQQLVSELEGMGNEPSSFWNPKKQEAYVKKREALEKRISKNTKEIQKLSEQRKVLTFEGKEALQGLIGKQDAEQPTLPPDQMPENAEEAADLLKLGRQYYGKKN